VINSYAISRNYTSAEQAWLLQPLFFTTTHCDSDHWVAIEDGLPGVGRTIEGVHRNIIHGAVYKSNSWFEVFDPSEPLGRMTHWRYPIAGSYK
jgi:hypothetical protein